MKLFNFKSFYRTSISICFSTLLFYSFPSLADTVKDEFTSPSYSNNDGSANWVTDWLEIVETDGANTGSVRIIDDLGTSRLRIRGDNFSSQEGLQREVDLLGATSATLTLDYRRVGLENAAEYVLLEISYDGGGNWAEIGRFNGPQNDASYQPFSYNLTSFTNNTRIKLTSSNSLDGFCFGESCFGDRDIVYFDNMQIDYTLPIINHFSISHDGAADNCLAEKITITKHTGAHILDATYTGTITLSTSTGNGNWSKTGTASDAEGTLTPGAIDSGATTYTFVAADNGSIDINLSNTNIETLNINITDGTDTESAIEDNDLVFSNLIQSTFRDEFSATSYSNNDGTGLWATDWLEINEADGAGSGDIRVTTNAGSGRLQIQGNNSSTQEGVQREVDLSSFTGATLSFDYRRVSLDNGAESVSVAVSYDGGTSWNILDTFSGPQNDTNYQSVSYNLASYTANTRIRFLGSASLDGSFFFFPGDRVYFDNIQIIGTTIKTCATIDHFSINYSSGSSSNGVNCQAEPITLEAHDASHSVVTTYTNTVNLSTSTNNGDWSNTGTAADALGTLTPGSGDSGSASYTFVAGDNGSVILNLKDTHTELTNLGMSQATINETSNSAIANDNHSITFASAGFDFLTDSTTNDIVTQIGGKRSDTAPNNQALELQAIKTGPTGTCESALQSTNDIEIAFECINPTNCTGNKLFISNDGGTTFNPLVGTPELTYTNLSGFDFGDNTDTTAPIIIRYDDVGKIKLHARKTLTPSNELMLGETNEFVVRPFALYPFIIGNPAATNASGSTFITAGTDFTVNVQAVLWQSADDDASGGVGIANDGIADGHELLDTSPVNNVSLADNTIANNYGQEIAPNNAPATPIEQVILNSILNQPAGANDPNLDDSSANGKRITSFNVATGIGTSNTINFDEVGIIEIAATVSDTNYLDIGITETAKMIGKSGYVGRFTPHHFETIVTHGCTGGSTFSYSAQPFIVTTYARNLNNATTLNYRDTFAYGVTLTDANPALPATGIFNNNTIGTASFSSNLPADGSNYGIGTSTDLSYTFINKETIPDVLDLRATDDNDTSISSNGFAEGTTEIRSGRIRVENAYGSELVDMAVPAQVKFYNTGGFEINTTDTCSIVTATLIDIGTDAITIGNGSGATQTCIIDDDGDSGADNCSDASVLPGLVTSQFESPPVSVSGSFNLNLLAPGANNTGDIGITLNSPTWLQFDWDGDGNHDNDPTGVVSFGLYRGDDRVIYWREVF